MKSDNDMCYKCKKKVKKLCNYRTKCEVCLLHAYTEHIHYLCANCNKSLLLIVWINNILSF